MSRIDHPRQLDDVRQFSVGDELVLVSSSPPQEGDENPSRRAITLNATGSAIWTLCDGTHSLDDMVDRLVETFPADRSIIRQHLDQGHL